jgi:hypothetical protein
VPGIDRPTLPDRERMDGWILKTLRAAAGERCRDVAYLLREWSKRNDAGSGKLLDGERDNWKSDLKVVEATIQYLQETVRLTNRPEEGQVG